MIPTLQLGGLGMRRLLSAVAPDPHWTNVASLLRFDGPHASTAIVDEKGKTWTVSGAAQLTTAQKKFGTASLNPSGGTIQSPSHVDFGFGAGKYTIEGWKRLASTAAGFACIFDNRNASNQGIAIYDRNASGSSFITVFDNAALIGATTIGVPDTVNFYHWMVCRDEDTMYAGIHGTVQSIGVDSRTYASAAVPVIGANYLGSQGQAGEDDEVRITYGVARYVSNYIPPPAPFPNY